MAREVMVSRERTRRLRRVVITGIGCISPNGLGREAYWDGLAKGRSGVGRISSFDPSSLGTTIAGEIKGLDLDKYVTAKDRRHVSRPVLLALAAATEAWADAE